MNMTAILWTIFTAAVAVLVGRPISAYWSTRQKRRELALATAERFYAAYGEFFAVWKLWNYSFKRLEDGSDVPSRPTEEHESVRNTLLERCLHAEAQFEGIFVKLVCERILAPQEIEVLGKFRQGCQELRAALRHNHRLKWEHREDPPYRAFKYMAADVAYLIATLDIAERPHPRDIGRRMLEITAGTWEQPEVWYTNLPESPDAVWELADHLDSWVRFGTHTRRASKR